MIMLPSWHMDSWVAPQICFRLCCSVFWTRHTLTRALRQLVTLVVLDKFYHHCKNPEKLSFIQIVLIQMQCPFDYLCMFMHVHPVGLDQDAGASHSSSLDWALLCKFAPGPPWWPPRRGLQVLGMFQLACALSPIPLWHPSALLKFPHLRHAMACSAAW